MDISDCIASITVGGKVIPLTGFDGDEDDLVVATKTYEVVNLGCYPKNHPDYMRDHYAVTLHSKQGITARVVLHKDSESLARILNTDPYGENLFSITTANHVTKGRVR